MPGNTKPGKQPQGIEKPRSRIRKNVNPKQPFPSPSTSQALSKEVVHLSLMLCCQANSFTGSTTAFSTRTRIKSKTKTIASSRRARKTSTSLAYKLCDQERRGYRQQRRSFYQLLRQSIIIIPSSHQEFLDSSGSTFLKPNLGL